MSHASNIYRLGTKELWSLARDPILLGLIGLYLQLLDLRLRDREA